MSERRRLPLGSGLDRYTGALAVRPGDLADVRDLLLGLGRAEVRQGMDPVADLSAWGETIVGGAAMVSEAAGVVAVYNRATGVVSLVRVDGDGRNPSHVGTLWTLAPNSPPPVVTMAEAFSRLLIAHHQPVVGQRQPTRIYDPLGVPPITTLQANLDGNGDADVKFGGVIEWADYIVGWGFGSASEDRPEFVRISKAGRPTEWDANHYFQAGQRNDPVVACARAGTTVVVFKASQTYRLVGTGLRDFGILPADTAFGLAAPRLFVTVGHRCYFWSLEGPRVTVGGESADLALPLDLKGPSPADLVAEGELEEAFALYVPGWRVVLFVFGQRVYVLDVTDPNRPEWAYAELGVTPFSGFVLYAGGDAASQPAAAPVFSAVLTQATHDEITVGWDNPDPSTQNLVEIWLNGPDGWERAAVVPSSGVPGQTHTLSAHPSLSETPYDVLPGTDYGIALRYRRGPYYNQGAEDDSNPSAWPAVSRGTVRTDLLPPEITAAVWERTSASSERIRLTIQPAHATAQIRVYRNGALIDTIPAPGSTAPITYDDTTAKGLTGEALHSYTAVSVIGAYTSAASAARTRWAGPDAPTITRLETSTVLGAAYEIEWKNAETATGGFVTQILDRNVTDGDPTFDVVKSPGYPNQGPEIVQHPGQGGDEYAVQIRHAVTAFGVTDTSRVSGPFFVTLSPS